MTLGQKIRHTLGSVKRAIVRRLPAKLNQKHSGDYVLERLDQFRSLPEPSRETFQKILETVLEVAKSQRFCDQPQVKSILQLLELRDLTLPDKLIYLFRQNLEKGPLPKPHFEELTFKIMELLIDYQGETSDPKILQIRQLIHSQPLDRVLFCLQEVHKIGSYSEPFLEELMNTALDMVAQSPAGLKKFSKQMGAIRIRDGQEAIIQNLARCVIGQSKFLVLDIGASDGWFIDRLLPDAPNVHLVAFEPNPEMKKELQATQTKWPEIEVFQMALGDEKSTLTLRVYPELPGLSSLLEFEKDYQYFKGRIDLNSVNLVEVPVERLDDLFATHSHWNEYDHIAIKLDVQGFEDRVLRGAEKLLSSGKVKAIMIEVSTREKYANSWDFLRIQNYFHEKGFTLFDANPFYREVDMVFQDEWHGQLTELDCTFVLNEFIPQIHANQTSTSDQKSTESK